MKFKYYFKSFSETTNEKKIILLLKKKIFKVKNFYYCIQLI